MALQATDLFVFQREGVLSQCPIGELQDKMQDTDLVMLQRDGGPLSKTTWGDKDNFQDTDLFVVHNGTQMCQTTWGAIAPNLALVKEIKLNKTETWDFSTQFTAEEWSGDKPKELYVRSSAVIYGQPGTPALTSGDTPFGGTLLVVIEGELYGGAGTANGGAGGTALKITNGVATVVNKNKMYGGGGGGGQGGQGGSGSYYVDSGCRANEGCNKNTCYNNNDCSSGLICTGGQGMCWDSSEDMQACCNCCVSRTYYYPEGGNGGDGGQGQDYLNAAGTGLVVLMAATAQAVVVPVVTVVTGVNPELLVKPVLTVIVEAVKLEVLAELLGITSKVPLVRLSQMKVKSKELLTSNAIHNHTKHYWSNHS